jgi:Glycosyl transferase family 2/Glycosyltransferase family 28 C-terminal domain
MYYNHTLHQKKQEISMAHRILFAVSSLGLGHATRTLPIIKSYVQTGWQVSVLSHGNALMFLREELKDKGVDFIELRDYPNLERGSGLAFFFYLVADLFTTCRLIFQERNFVKQREGQYDCIISDGRYGICSHCIPSFIISHQISFVIPKGLGLFRFIVDQGNRFFLGRFDKVFIPDFPSGRFNLSGQLSHNRVTEHLLHQWVGILSSYIREEVDGEIAYLFIISGYLQEQRQSFTGRLIEQAKNLPATKVFILGDTSTRKVTRLQKKDITIYPVATGALRTRLFNQARLIVSRSGYTTIMDLAELEKPAVLFATPRQTEQEYLADLLGANGWYITSREQDHLDLSALVDEVQHTKPFKPPWKTKKSLEMIHKEVLNHLRDNRFSFVIPAHNEEQYIGETLERIVRLDYPKDRYEVIVVENGSLDATWKAIKPFEDACDNVYAFTCAQGVSRARNMGFAKTSPESDWIIFLDADIHLQQGFLLELNQYLGKHVDRNLGVGTTSIRPSDDFSARARQWFRLYDLWHRVTHTSYSLQIVRAGVAANIHYDERLSYSEDLDYLKQAGPYGRFFFFKTDAVMCSARRFARYGYLQQTLIWLYQAMQPVSVKKKKRYEVVR